ncbi:hypothetical protein A0H81_14429 [Grifola frondosa]|uniref:DUF6699 domain-containing protein n=1 Tax=Grifola frondosa TaxID=5627 RepID=A0A1C7LN29_GRIFR|nr:hypothetical protein A0H81_14429 [Grifola frondosa]
MPSYFRNLFGGQSSQSSSKTHSRSSSQPPVGNIYAVPGNASAAAAGPNAKVQRSYSYSASRSTAPSPLRFTTGTDTRTTYGYGSRTDYAQQTAESRPRVPRSASHPAREPGHLRARDPTRARRCIQEWASRGRQAPTWATAPMPALPSDRTNLGNLTAVWRLSACANALTLLAQLCAGACHSPLHAPSTRLTRLHRAPITYDVSFTPSARTVLDRATHSAIPAHTLSQPATEPPTPAGSRLVLRCEKFPWPVIVSGSLSNSHSSPTRPRFTIGSASSHGHSAAGGVITNLDVLYAVHTTLLTPITPEEWEALGHGSKAQQKVTRAYERRCTRMGGGGGRRAAHRLARGEDAPRRRGGRQERGARGREETRVREGVSARAGLILVVFGLRGFWLDIHSSMHVYNILLWTLNARRGRYTSTRPYSAHLYAHVFIAYHAYVLCIIAYHIREECPIKGATWNLTKKDTRNRHAYIAPTGPCTRYSPAKNARDAARKRADPRIFGFAAQEQLTPSSGKSYVPGIATTQPALSWCELQFIWSFAVAQHRRQKRPAEGSTLSKDTESERERKIVI